MTALVAEMENTFLSQDGLSLLKLEGVVMLDKQEILYQVTGNKNFNIKISEPFNQLSIEFLNDFSNNLKKYNKINSYPDLIYLMFWCRRKKIENLAKDFKSNKLRLGRGLIFHICPSNVPTNFVYSFFFGLLSGNSNIVKVPSINFKEKEIITNLPENYTKSKFANKKTNFKCKILNIKKPEIVKINDQFAKNLGAKNLNDLKQLVRQQIQNQYKMNLDALSKDNILNQIEKLHDIDLPNNLVQQELALMSQGLKKEDAEKNKKENEKIAKKRIKLGLILNELGEKNNLKVDEQELKNEIQKQVQSIPGQQKQVLEYYQKNPSATASLRGSMYEEKIINLIKQKSKQTKKTISIKEADLLIEEQHRTHEHFKGKESKTPKKTVKSLEKKKKIRKK